MSKIISGVILLFTFLTIFPETSYAVSINPDPIGNISVDVVQDVIIWDLDPSKEYRFREEKEVSPGVWNEIYHRCFIPLTFPFAPSDGYTIRDLGPSSEVGNYRLSVFWVGSAADPLPPDECIPFAHKFEEITRTFTIGGGGVSPPITISPDRLTDIPVGEKLTVTVSGLRPNTSYAWVEEIYTRHIATGDPSWKTYWQGCFTSDGSGQLSQYIEPKDVGTYKLVIYNTFPSIFGSCLKSKPIISLGYTAGGGILTPSCSIRTAPDPVIEIAPNAKFTVDVANTSAYPNWKMEFECGLPHNVGPATIEDSKEISRTMNSIGGGLSCEFSDGDHTIKIIGSASGGDAFVCRANYTVTPTSAIYGTCKWDGAPPKLLENNCKGGTVPTAVPAAGGRAISFTCRCLPPRDTPPPPGIPVTSGGETCGTKENPGFKTAIGCIHTNPEKFVQDLLKFTIAISGGLAFLLMLLGAFQMLTSAGNPETLHSGRERFTNAIIGLLFIIFAILLLQVIGVDILGLRELGK